MNGVTLQLHRLKLMCLHRQGKKKQQLLVYAQSPNKQVTVLLFLQGQAYISIKTGLGTFTDAVGPSDFTFDRN